MLNPQRPSPASLLLQLNIGPGDIHKKVKAERQKQKSLEAMASSSSHPNPFHSRPASRIPSNSSSGSSSSSYPHNSHRHWSHNQADMPEPFTSEMRDRQARGKDPYLPEAADSGHLGGGRGNMHHSGMRNRNGGGGGSGVSRQVTLFDCLF